VVTINILGHPAPGIPMTQPPLPRRSLARTVVFGLGRALHFSWDILGVTLLMLVALLLLLGLGRRLFSRPDAALEQTHPYAAEPWSRLLESEFQASLRMQWESYTYWRRRAISGQFVNVDSLGHRRTIPAGPPNGARHVIFLGGSTLWGTGQRDAYTIPSLVAAQLGAQGLGDVRLENYGETGYVFTQEAIRLLLALRDGARPSLVVFYDGINDLFATAIDGRCGIPQNERRRAVEFAIGRFLNTRGWQELKDLLSTAWTRGVGGQTADMQPRAGVSQDSAGAIHAAQTLACYRATAELVEALAKLYGFQVLYVWQPMPATTTKPLTAYEAAVLARLEQGPLLPSVAASGRVAAGRVDSIMRSLVGTRFLNLTALFSGDSGSVWLDEIGHLTERANTRVAGALLPAILDALKQPVSR